MNPVEEFESYRERLNERIFQAESLITNRFFNLDTHAYQAGDLSAVHKELMGLCASLVLRCDDCVKYHILQSVRQGATTRSIYETFEIALVIGGSILIPHLRRAFEFLDACLAEESMAN
jgi:AhpD family alkylhydroperoxidase